MTAYYNEHDPFAAAWLRNLIAAGHIAPGEVDERSIEDVSPADLAGFTQCHFFAGIGVWSYALRSAGWSDDRPVWTGSCPCQPFSAAGKGGGFADERHLWPAFFHLIQQRQPAIILGEQVASKDGLAWLDLVRADVEGAGWAFAAADLCAAGVGAPHIRQRSFWVADAGDRQRNGEPVIRGTIRDREDAGWTQGGGEFEPRRDISGLADATDQRHEWGWPARDGRNGLQDCGNISGMADANLRGRKPEQNEQCAGIQLEINGTAPAWVQPRHDNASNDKTRSASPTNGFWRDADWLYCRDGKWRPVESGTSPLAHGATNRVGRLRGYGNAIVAPVAQAFIESVMEIC